MLARCRRARCVTVAAQFSQEAVKSETLTHGQSSSPASRRSCLSASKTTQHHISTWSPLVQNSSPARLRDARPRWPRAESAYSVIYSLTFRPTDGSSLTRSSAPCAEHVPWCRTVKSLSPTTTTVCHRLSLRCQIRRAVPGCCHVPLVYRCRSAPALHQAQAGRRVWPFLARLAAGVAAGEASTTAGGIASAKKIATSPCAIVRVDKKLRHDEVFARAHAYGHRSCPSAAHTRPQSTTARRTATGGARVPLARSRRAVRCGPRRFAAVTFALHRLFHSNCAELTSLNNYNLRNAFSLIPSGARSRRSIKLLNRDQSQ